MKVTIQGNENDISQQIPKVEFVNSNGELIAKIENGEIIIIGKNAFTETTMIDGTKTMYVYEVLTNDQ